MPVDSVVRLPSRPGVASIRFWVLAIIAAATLLAGTEAALRADILWRLPVTWVVQWPMDTHTRTVWRLHREPITSNEVVVFGSSSTDALVEPVGRLRQGQDLVDSAVGPGRVRVLNLAVNLGCYAEALVIASNLVARGHHPEVALVFASPDCVARDKGVDEAAAVLARRMPIIAEELLAEVPADSFDERLQRAALRHSALARYQVPDVNGWIRRRSRDMLRAYVPLFARPNPLDRNKPWRGPSKDDLKVLQGAARLQIAAAGPDTKPLEALLQFFRTRGIKVQLVEEPLSPPVRQALAASLAGYHDVMRTTAARFGATYVDPNEETPLENHDFFDMLHVTPLGAAKYMPTVARHLAEVLP